MKAILIREPGDPDVLVYGDAPDPQPAEDELLVRVHATALNRADLLQRKGGYVPPEGASPILGLEVAGEVVSAGGGWNAGDRVMAVITGGGYAELAAVPIGMLMPIPRAFSYEQAAAIPEAYLTAWLNLFTMGRLNSGEAVLIHAGASGVGSAAIQLAREAGARVFTTAGTEAKCEFCRELGAELTINYRQESFRERVLEATGGRGVDLALDVVGAPYWNDNLACLGRGGRLMLIGFLGGSGGQLDVGAVMRKNLTVRGTLLRRTPLPEKIALTGDFVNFALPRFERDTLRPVIDRVFPLSQAAEAHRYMHTNANIGKIILKVD